jgi:hypothetical protein
MIIIPGTPEHYAHASIFKTNKNDTPKSKKNVPLEY